MKPKFHRSLSSLFSITLVASTAMSGIASATDIVWGTNLGAGPWIWNDGANWTGGTAPVVSTDRGDLRKDWTAAATINLNAATLVNGVLFDDTGSTSDVGVTIGNGGTAANTLTLAGSTPVLQGSGPTLTIGAVLAGTTAWSKTGAGTVVLNNAANTITGVVTVNAGVLQIRDGSTNTPAVFNNLTGKSITVQTGAVLDLPRLHALSNQNVTWTLPPISLESGSTLRFRASTGSNTHGLAANIANAGTTTIDNNGGGYSQSINYTGVISGSGTIQYKTANSGSSDGVVRTLAMKTASPLYTGGWFVQHVNSGNDFGALQSDVANGLGTGTVTIDDRARLVSNAANSLNSLSGVTLAKSTSTLTLNQHAWTNTAATLTVNAGTVTLGNGANAGNASIGNLSGTGGSIITVGTAATASSLTLNQTADTTFAGTIAPITGTSISLAKNGGSRLTLSAATPISGAGTVALVMNNGTLAFGNGTTAFGTANLASVNQTGGNLHVDLNSANSDVINVAGNYAQTGGGIVVQVAGVPNLATPYTIVNYGGALTGTPAVTFQGLAGTRISASADLGTGSNSSISVSFTGGPASLVWTGTTDNTWEAGGATNNWLNGITPDNYLEYDNVMFNDDATSGNLSPNLATAISPNLVTFNNATNTYLLTGSGSIAGVGSMVKDGAGIATIATTNTYSGGTDVLAGTLIVGNGGTTGSLGSGVVSVDTAATLSFKRSDTITPALNTLSGSGTMTQNGSGILALTTAQTFNGALVGNAGTIQIGDGSNNTPASPVSSVSGITMNTGSILDLPRVHSSGGENVTWSLPALSLQGGSTIRFRCTNGSTFHSSSTDIGVNGAVTIDNAGGNYDQDITLSGNLSGSGTLSYKTANSPTGLGYARSLTLMAGSSSYSGNWFVQHAAASDDFGQLVSASVGSLGTGTVTLDTRAQLISNVAGGLDSLSGVSLLQSTSTASFNTGWTNPAGVLTLTNGTVSVGTTSAFSILDIASVTQTGGVINLDIGDTSNDNDTITVSGDADFTGGQIVLIPASNPDDLSYDIVTYGGSLIVPPLVTADAGRLTPNVVNGDGSNDKITVTFTGDVASLVWKGNDLTNPNNWDKNTTQNFDNAGSPDVFLTFDNVTFDDTAASFAPSIIGSLKTGTVTFNNSTNAYVLSGTGAIDGPAALVKAAPTAPPSRPPTHSPATSPSMEAQSCWEMRRHLAAAPAEPRPLRSTPAAKSI